MMAEFNWTCPTCHMYQTITNARSDINILDFSVGTSKHGTKHFVETKVICCSNPKCGDVYFYNKLIGSNVSINNRNHSSAILVKIADTNNEPGNTHSPQPDYIPMPLREDYYEACKIVHLSPKASATLTRRCLQGMIRDFCKISKPTLYKEIEELKNAYKDDNAPKGVTDETVEAIDHVRTIGNIGAHMEKDIDKIIDIDPGEAEALIGLVELLFEEWYVARHKRSQKLAKIKAIKIDKEEKKKTPVASAAPKARDEPT